jgi:phenylalanyl-tRNA synthetase beta chain
MGVKPENFVELANPVSSEYAVFRKSILPELLDFFARNKTVAFPQRVFEIGRVLELDSSRPYGYVSRYMLCVAISDAKVDFNEIKRYLDAFALNSGISYKLKKHDFPWLEKGIGAEIFVGSKSIGFIGEVSKQVRENFGLTAKVAAFELELFEEPNYFD